MMKQQNPTDNGSSASNNIRDCWGSARERARLKARFKIRQRILVDSSCPATSSSICSETNGSFSQPAGNDAVNSFAAVEIAGVKPRDETLHTKGALVCRTDDDKDESRGGGKHYVDLSQQSIILLQEALQRILLNNRCFFSLTRLEGNAVLYSEPFESDLLYEIEDTTNNNNADGGTTKTTPNRILLGKEKLVSWFGPTFHDQLDKVLSERVQTITLLEVALIFRRYGIVRALLIGGVNPCLCGTLQMTGTTPDSDNSHVVVPPLDWDNALEQLGSRVLRYFLEQLVPLSMQTYILKRAFEFKYRTWTNSLSPPPSSSIMKQKTCVLCQQMTPLSYLLCMDIPCSHEICQLCFWNNMVDSLDERDGNVVPCFACVHLKEFKTEKLDPLAPSTATPEGDYSQLLNESRFQLTREKFFAMPRDGVELKQQPAPKSQPLSKPRGKKKYLETPFASTWAQAVTLSVGNSQDVRRERFFTYVERGAVHYVQGCLEAGMDLEAKNEYGQTGLYMAAWRGHLRVVHLLLQYYAGCPTTTILATANDGTTPLYAAQQHGHLVIVNLFMSHLGLSPSTTTQEESVLCPANDDELRSSESLHVSTLIRCSEDHPGAGSYTIDGVLSEVELQKLLALWKRLPTESPPSAKKKSGLCSVRSYYCDVDQFIARILLRALAALSENQVKNNEIKTTEDLFIVLPFMRFLSYDKAGIRLAPHVDLNRVDLESGIRSTHSFLLYLTDCHVGGETSLLKDLSRGSEEDNITARVKPKAGRLLLFPHVCPHEGEVVVDVPKLLIRGEVYLGTLTK
ncbi:hypothetical protein ACA910_006016 [Epithemia clementina (nom. ined.)]